MVSKVLSMSRYLTSPNRTPSFLARSSKCSGRTCAHKKSSEGPREIEDTLRRLQEKGRELKEMKAALQEEFARISRKMADELQESETGTFSTDEYRDLCGT